MFGDIADREVDLGEMSHVGTGGLRRDELNSWGDARAQAPRGWGLLLQACPLRGARDYD